MKVVIIGSGGREHALCVSLKKSRNISKIYCIPGNAGTSKIAENVSMNLDDFKTIKEFVKKNGIEIVIIGPEKPLVDGLTDFLENEEIKVFGPSKLASQLEGSKIFTKNLCEKYGIPTAKFGVFENFNCALNYLKNCKLPVVVKADGLAAGKGVYICENKQQSKDAIKEIFDGKFGVAKQVLIEDFLKGEEMSFFIISDGRTFKKFGTAQDHKRVFEGDKGKNTGGMGSYSPSRLENETLNNKILDKIINPTLQGLKELEIEFKGFLYAGLMIVDNDPYLIEYNVRMGDPECQTILPKLKTDFADIIHACVNNKLNSTKIDWSYEKSLCIVLCSKGYPENYTKNVEIINLDKLDLKDDEFIYHAGTKKSGQKVLSDGGRVLNFVIKSNNFKFCRDRAIELIKQLNWKNGFFRKDIGFKVIDK
tara:strand:- start:411 stop:1676 length:1266 start_codon:yes stop_codon:yes gene_type:complete